MRFKLPATQRTPSPKSTPFGFCTFPCKKIESTLGNSPLECRVSESSTVCPLVES